MEWLIMALLLYNLYFNLINNNNNSNNINNNNNKLTKIIINNLINNNNNNFRIQDRVFHLEMNMPEVNKQMSKLKNKKCSIN